VQTSSQLAPTVARGVGSGTRRRDGCRAFVLPNVRELPLRLERVVADGFGGLVGSHAASRAAATTTIIHPRGALS
jgi:hypothetical protein